MITIWVDADACPKAIREILCRASIRTKTELNFIANSPVPLPKAKQINFFQVPRGFDIADNEILKRANPKDLVITSDIPLAADLIVKQGAKEVFYLEGGLSSWIDNNMPLSGGK